MDDDKLHSMLWWMDYELQEKKKRMPMKKGGISNKNPFALFYSENETWKILELQNDGSAH